LSSKTFRLSLPRPLIAMGNPKNNLSSEKAGTLIAPEVKDSWHNGAGRGCKNRWS
jgi:hypothetical protein